MSGLPKPSLPYVIVSCLTIAASLFLIFFGIVAFSRTWDPCSLIGGAVLLPLPSALAMQQYRATFLLVRRAAKTAAILLFIVSGFAALACVTTLGESVASGGAIPWVLLLPMFAIALVCGFVGWLNIRWARTLPESVEPALRSSFTLRELFAAVAAFGVMTAITIAIVRSTPPRYAEHVDIADAPFGLPLVATDISYCQGVRGTIAYEFTIEESDFREWVESRIGSAESESANVAILPITTPISVTRYNAISSDLTGLDSISVGRGLHYSRSFESDGGIHAVFDSTTNRAYYYAHFH